MLMFLKLLLDDFKLRYSKIEPNRDPRGVFLRSGKIDRLSTVENR